MDWRIDEWREAEKNKKPRKRPCYKEDRLNINCVRWFDIQYPEYWAALNHSPNEGKRSELQGSLLKQKGMRAGIADIILMLPTAKYNFLAIELKTKGDSKKGVRSGSQSKEEKMWQEKAERVNCLYRIVRTLEEFHIIVDRYIRLHEEFKALLAYVTEIHQTKEVEEQDRQAGF